MGKRLLGSFVLGALLILVAISWKQPLPPAHGQTAGPVLVGSVSDMNVLVIGRSIVLSPRGQPSIVLSIEDARALSADLDQAAQMAETAP
jgi:hypothetical protein